MSSIFKLKTSIGELESANQQINNMKYEQYAPSRDVTGQNFSNGEIRFKFDISGSKWVLMNRSYLLFRIKITKGNGTAWKRGDDVAPNMNIAANLFQSCEFRINEKTVSRISDYVPQVSALHTRLNKSDAWLKTIGKSSAFWETDRAVRSQDLADDGELYVYSTTGDANIGANQARQTNEFQVIWVPPLSCFDIDNALPVGSYQLILTPRATTEYPKYAVETADNKNVGDTAADIKVSVEDMYLYINTVEGQRIENASYLLDLTHIRCQAEKVQGKDFAQQLFNVSPSTVALTCAFQDSRCGTDTRLSSSKFKAYPNAVDLATPTETLLNRFYINYSGVNLPQPDLQSTLNGAIDLTTQLYNESLLYSGAYYDTGGSEDIKTFRDGRGLYIHQLRPKDGSDRSTRVSVSAGFRAEIGDNMRMLLFDHSKQVCKVRIQDSQVVSVELEDV